jgi:hypothetical protein
MRWSRKREPTAAQAEYAFELDAPDAPRSDSAAADAGLLPDGVDPWVATTLAAYGGLTYVGGLLRFLRTDHVAEHSVLLGEVYDQSVWVFADVAGGGEIVVYRDGEHAGEVGLSNPWQPSLGQLRSTDPEEFLRHRLPQREVADLVTSPGLIADWVARGNHVPGPGECLGWVDPATAWPMTRVPPNNCRVWRVTDYLRALRGPVRAYRRRIGRQGTR